jgi:hypothetical protein
LGDYDEKAGRTGYWLLLLFSLVAFSCDPIREFSDFVLRPNLGNNANGWIFAAMIGIYHERWIIYEAGDHRSTTADQFRTAVGETGNAFLP